MILRLSSNNVTMQPTYFGNMHSSMQENVDKQPHLYCYCTHTKTNTYVVPSIPIVHLY